jgi:radical SAM protein (TIGR04043 family)
MGRLEPKPWKVELLCWGLKAPIRDKGRRGGAGPAGGRYVEVRGDVVNARMRFVRDTPLELRMVEGSVITIIDSRGKTLKGRLIPNPPFYSKKTSRGTPMVKVARLHGRDCLATTLYQSCSLRERCSFCAIDVSFRSGDALLWKNPHDLLEVAKSSEAKHWTITSGYHPRLNEKMVEALEILKEGDDRPIHVQVGPGEDLKALNEAGADTLGIHIETLDEKALSYHCPGKFAMGHGKFIKALKRGVEIFGEGQVSTFVVLGLGEERDVTLEGMEDLVREGIVPFLTPLRPLGGSMGLEAPDPEYMLGFYCALSDMFDRYGLDPRKSRAGCVRCGACWGL